MGLRGCSDGVRGLGPGSKPGTSLQRDIFVATNTVVQNENFSFSVALLGEKRVKQALKILFLFD